MLLNIDKLIGEPKEIIFGGVTYKVEEITVELYLEIMSAQTADTDNTERIIELVERIVPGLNAKKIPMRILSQMMEFLMAQSEADLEKNGVNPA